MSFELFIQAFKWEWSWGWGDPNKTREMAKVAITILTIGIEFGLYVQMVYLPEEHLPPPFYNSAETYEEAEMEENKKHRSYTDVVASLETHISYIREDIAGIHEHLKLQNGSEMRQDIRIAKNTDRIGLAWKIWVGIPIILIGGIISLGLKLLGVY